LERAKGMWLDGWMRGRATNGKRPIILNTTVAIIAGSVPPFALTGESGSSDLEVPGSLESGEGFEGIAKLSRGKA
jgi:hypothetical protein